MNKKKFNISNYFNVKLFFEAFKQIRIVGLIFFVCLNALAIFAPILYKADAMYESFEYQVLLDIESCMFPLLSLIYIAAPIMFIILFKFLTKRNGSDFHHSLPVKRSCLFITYISAITSWLLFISITYTAILLVSANVCTSLFVIDYSVIMAYLINIIVSSFIIIGIFSIGTAISGTLTSNVIFSLGLLIIPRLLIVAFYDLVATFSYSLSYNSALLFFSPKCNIPFALIADMFEFIGGTDSIFASINGNTLYTFVLAIIYLLIGLRLFITRPSEVAGKSFRNRKLFAALKYGTGLLISLIIVVTSYYDIYEENYDFMEYQVIEYSLVILAIALVMFAMEAATSKSIKKGLKTMLATPFILMIDVIIIYSAMAVTNYYNNEEINPANVDYVRVEFTNSRYYYDEYYYDDDYDFIDKIKEIKITDKDLIKMLTDAYNSDRAEIAYDSYYSNYRDITITFDSTFGEKNRCVYLTQQEYETLQKTIFNNSDVINNMYQFPDKDSAAIHCDSLSVQQCQALYESLINEINSLPTDKLYPDLYDLFNSNDSNYSKVGELSISYYGDGKRTYDYLPISSLTPKTYAMYMTYVNENAKNTLLSILDELKGDYRKTSVYLYGYFSDALADGTSTEAYYYNATDKYLNFENNFNIIKDSLLAYYDADKPFDYNELFTGKYYLAYLTLAYNPLSNFYVEDFYNYDNSQYGTTYDGTKYGSFYLLLPTDTPLIEGLDNYRDDGYYDGYDYDVYYD